MSAVGKKEDVQEIRFVYKYCKDGTLNRGNVKYFAELEDGRGYIFLYSANTKMIYNFYKVHNYEDVLRWENRIEKLQKQKGILVKNRVAE